MNLPRQVHRSRTELKLTACKLATSNQTKTIQMAGSEHDLSFLAPSASSYAPLAIRPVWVSSRSTGASTNFKLSTLFDRLNSLHLCLPVPGSWNRWERYSTVWPAGDSYSRSIAYGTSILVLTHCTKYWQFMLALGIMGGIGAAAITTAGLSVVNHWFKKCRGLACGMAMMGSALGGIAFPLI